MAVAIEHLKSFIERIERLNEEKDAMTKDIAEVYNEAKGSGFDPKVMKQVVRLRKLDAHERQELEGLLELYMGALT